MKNAKISTEPTTVGSIVVGSMTMNAALGTVFQLHSNTTLPVFVDSCQRTYNHQVGYNSKTVPCYMPPQ